MNQPSVVVDTTFRLTSQETRAILQVSGQGGKPVKINGWGASQNLLDIGILKKVLINPVKVDSKPLWSALCSAAARKRLRPVEIALQKLHDAKRSTRVETAYTLTPFGKKIADGIREKLNRRYVGVNATK